MFVGEKSLSVPTSDKRKLSEVSNIIATQMDSLINSMSDNDSLLVKSPCKLMIYFTYFLFLFMVM